MNRKFTSSSGVIRIINKFLHLFVTKFSLFFFVTVCCVLFFLQKNEYKGYEYVRSNVVDFCAPIIQKIGNTINYVFEAKLVIIRLINVYEENKQLRSQVNNLENYSRLYDKAINENKELKKLLKYVEKINEHHFTARVLINNNSPFASSVVVSAGKLEGVYKGQIVMNNKGLIGRITEVNNHTSRVLLIYDPKSRIAAISAKNRERGIVAGNSSNNLDLIYTRDTAVLEDGEMILSSGDGALIPYGFPIGVVKKISDTKFIIKPFVNIHEIEYVVIVDNDE